MKEILGPKILMKPSKKGFSYKPFDQKSPVQTVPVVVGGDKLTTHGHGNVKTESA